MYLLDTNVISETRKLGSTRIHADASAWFNEVDLSQCYLSAMTLFELELSVRLMERRDGPQGMAIRKWLTDQVMISFTNRILPLSDKVAVICAGFHVPNRKAERDAWIAATAVAAGLTLATRNVVDFSGIGVSIVNPFESQSG
jgi:toxin FitB